MHRTCCRAANAYDPALALRHIFAASTRNFHPTPSPSRAQRPRPHGAIFHGTSRLTGNGHGEYRKRLYGTKRERVAEDTSEWSAIEAEEAQSERLSLFESVLGPESSEPRRDRLRARRSVERAEHAHSQTGPDTASGRASSRGGRRTDPGTSQSSPNYDRAGSQVKPDRLQWRNHMSALTQTARHWNHDKDADVATGRAVLDYDARIIYPQVADVEQDSLVPWAMHSEDRISLPPMEVLDEEIRRFANFMAPSVAEDAACNSVIRSIKTLVRKVMGRDIVPYVHGSRAYGTSMPFSDIDIGIFNHRATGRDPAALAREMGALYQYMSIQSRDYICVVFRPEGPYPIITAQHKATGIDIQIVATRPSNLRQAGEVQHYLSAVPNMLSLYTVIRTMFGMRGFVDTFIGGVSAYGTFMMLAASLTRRGLPSSVHASPGAQLLQFLSFYASFDTTKQGLTLLAKGSSERASAPIKKYDPDSRGVSRVNLTNAAIARGDNIRASQYNLARLRPLQPYLLCLQDPADNRNDLGGRCNAIKHIMRTIQHLHELVPERMARDVHKKRNDNAASLLEPVVGRCHEVYAERRRKVEQFGLGELEQKGLTNEGLIPKRKRSRREKRKHNTREISPEDPNQVTDAHETSGRVEGVEKAEHERREEKIDESQGEDGSNERP